MFACPNNLIAKVAAGQLCKVSQSRVLLHGGIITLAIHLDTSH